MELSPDGQRLVGAFRDCVVRYADEDEKALSAWGSVLTVIANDNAHWGKLPFPKDSSGPLREALLAAYGIEAPRAELQSAFASGLSAWDSEVAVLRLLRLVNEPAARRNPRVPVTDASVRQALPLAAEGSGLYNQRLLDMLAVVRRQRFFALVGGALGVEGLEALRAEVEPVHRQLHAADLPLFDPWLLAHPDSTVPDPSKAEAG